MTTRSRPTAHPAIPGPARADGRGARRAALAALIAAALALGPGRVHPAEGDARPALQAGTARPHVSQYARLAQQPKLVGRTSARGPGARAVGAGARPGTRAHR